MIRFLVISMFFFLLTGCILKEDGSRAELTYSSDAGASNPVSSSLGGMVNSVGSSSESSSIEGWLSESSSSIAVGEEVPVSSSDTLFKGYLATQFSGKRIKSIRLEYMGGDTSALEMQPTSMEMFSYDDLGRIAFRRSYAYESFAGSPFVLQQNWSNEEEYRYSEGMLPEVLISSYQSKEHGLKSDVSKVYSYNEGFLSSVKLFTTANGGREVSYELFYGYSDGGLLLEKKSVNYTKNSQNITRFEYDQNKLNKVSDDEEVKIYYGYGQNGAVIQEYWLRPASEWTTNTREDFLYSGDTITVDRYIKVDASGVGGELFSRRVVVLEDGETSYLRFLDLLGCVNIAMPQS